MVAEQPEVVGSNETVGGIAVLVQVFLSRPVVPAGVSSRLIFVVGRGGGNGRSKKMNNDKDENENESESESESENEKVKVINFLVFNFFYFGYV